MPTPHRGVTYYRRKGIEESLHHLSIYLRSVRNVWAAQIRDETDLKIYRKYRDKVVAALEEKSKELIQTIKNVENSHFPTYFNAGTQKWIQLTPALKVKRAKQADVFLAARYLRARANSKVSRHPSINPDDPTNLAWRRGRKTPKKPRKSSVVAAEKRERTKKDLAMLQKKSKSSK